MTDEIKIAHIADCHLRQRQYKNEARGKAFTRGLVNAIHAAKNAGAHAIICAGDMLDTNNPGARVCIGELNKVRRALEETGLIMYLTSGNHDGDRPNWCKRFDGEPFVVIDDEIVAIRNRESQTGSEITVKGLPFMLPNEFREAIKESVSEADIVVWHGEIKEFCGYPKPNAVELADIPAGKKCRLLAMGDQHIHKLLVAPSGVPVAYPGSTELCSIAEDPQKYLYLHTFRRAAPAAPWELVSSESVPFETQPVQMFTIKTEDDMQAMLANIKQGSIVSVRYIEGIADVNDRVTAKVKALEEAKTEDSRYTTVAIVRQTYEKKETVYDKMKTGTSAVQKPHEYIRTVAEQIFSEDDKDRLVDTCAALLDPNIDSKKTIDTFCMKALDGTITV